MLHLDERLAVILSACVGASFVFIANKFFTFRNREPAVGQFFRFVLVYGLAILLNALFSNFLIWLGIHYLLAKMIAIGFGTIWNYLFSHSFIFRKIAKEDDVIIV